MDRWQPLKRTVFVSWQKPRPRSPLHSHLSLGADEMSSSVACRVVSGRQLVLSALLWPQSTLLFHRLADVSYFRAVWLSTLLFLTFLASQWLLYSFGLLRRASKLFHSREVMFNWFSLLFVVCLPLGFVGTLLTRISLIRQALLVLWFFCLTMALSLAYEGEFGLTFGKTAGDILLAHLALSLLLHFGLVFGIGYNLVLAATALVILTRLAGITPTQSPTGERRRSGGKKSPVASHSERTAPGSSPKASPRGASVGATASTTASSSSSLPTLFSSPHPHLSSPFSPNQVRNSISNTNASSNATRDSEDSGRDPILIETSRANATTKSLSAPNIPIIPNLQRYRQMDSNDFTGSQTTPRRSPRRLSPTSASSATL